MSSLKLNGSTSGYVEIVPPAVAGNNSVTLPSGSGTLVTGDSGGNLNISGIVTATSFVIGAGSTASPSLSPTGDSNTGIFFPAADTIAFGEGGVEVVRIDNSGRLSVGATISPTPGTNLLKVVGSTSGSIFGGTLSLTQGRTPPNGSSLGVLNFGSEANPDSAQIASTAEGAWTAGVAHPSNLIFYTTPSASTSQTERMKIWNDGSVTIPSTKDLYGVTATYGVALNSYGAGDIQCAANAATVAFFNRCQNDGTIVSLRQAGTEEGAISVSGTTVTYGGGHIARWSQLPDEEDPSTILKGTIMSNLDEMCEWGDEDNEQLNKTKVSDVEGDPNVAGVFVSTSFSEDGPLDFFVAMTGDMIIRIAEGVTVRRGDLLMSAGDGTAKPQGDGFVQNKTIAKVTSTHVTCTYEDGSYCVPCVLMAC